ncbi:MAG: flippase [Terriglobia bacterium]
MATLSQTLPRQSTSGRSPRRTLLNTAAIFSGEAVSRLATALMALLVARRFGAEALGQYGYALSLASVLVIVPDLGLHLLTTRSLAAEPQRLARTFWNLHVLKIPLASAVVLFTVFFGEWTIRDDGRRLLLYVLVARAMLQTFSLAYMAIFKAFERMHYIAMAQIVNALFVIACVGAAMGLSLAAPLVVASFLAGQAAETWFCWRILHREFSPGGFTGLDRRLLRSMMLGALPIGITAVLQALNLRLDVLILGIFTSNEGLGHFQAAAWFVIGPFLGASLLMTVLFPRLSRLLRAPSAQGSAYVESLVKLAFLSMALVALMIWLVAPHLLNLTFGRDLAPAASLLRILAPALPCVFLNTVLFYVFVAARRRTAYLATLLLGLMVGTALAFFLAPRFGPAGSAAADVVREIIMTASFLYFLCREGLAPEAGKTLLKLLVGASMLCVAGAACAGNSVGESWPAVWILLLIAGTLALSGIPRRHDLRLVLNEEP